MTLVDENHCRAPDVTTAYDSSTQTRWQCLFPGLAVTVLDAIAGCGMSGLLWSTDSLESWAVWRTGRRAWSVGGNTYRATGHGNGRHGGYTVFRLVEFVPA